MELPDLLMLAFATYAMAHTVTHEAGPANIFGRIRAIVGAELALKEIPALDDEERWDVPEQLELGSLAQLFSCPYCMSFYAAALSVVLWAHLWPIFALIAVFGMGMFIVDITR